MALVRVHAHATLSADLAGRRSPAREVDRSGRGVATTGVGGLRESPDAKPAAQWQPAADSSTIGG
jgi:hypothetical protein